MTMNPFVRIVTGCSQEKRDIDQVLMWSDLLKDSIYHVLDITLQLQLQAYLHGDDNADLRSTGSHLTVSDDSSMNLFTRSYLQRWNIISWFFNEFVYSFLSSRWNIISISKCSSTWYSWCCAEHSSPQIHWLRHWFRPATPIWEIPSLLTQLGKSKFTEKQ